MAGAPNGNTNSAKGKRFLKAMERALAHKYGSVEDGLLAVARTVLNEAESNGQTALAIADRFDGKPHQSIGTDSDHGPLQITVTAIETKL